MPIKINVPFSQKDEAKKLGAVWIPDSKTWIIPNSIKDVNPFKIWLPKERASFVKYPYLIAVSSRICWKCHKETPLIGLAAKNYITSVFDSTLTETFWSAYDYPAFFVDIRSFDDELALIIRERFPFFQKMYLKALADEIWVNSCIHCQTIQGDNYNIQSPNHPFGGYLNEKRTLLRNKKIEQIQLKFDYYINSAIYEGEYYWDGFTEAE